ncbi:hypothetical protein AGMMS49545_18490 [Betaproteobacteria bacterium]|nr:hypothetical protein AGMMS49545_18490 [Betaproteobacteria bacterium]GHU46411.1 hypothetical protein AGMMS50289_19800 [Betaproteobacteria bacterium]
MPHPVLSCVGDVALVACVLLAGTIFPRLMVVGGLPAMDECVYAFSAQWIHHSIASGHGIPNAGSLSLYPMLFYWVFNLDYNPVIALRFADMCVAVLTSFFLYTVLYKESKNKIGAVLIALVFTFTMNSFIFIDYGFKNSIMAAFAPLFLAIRIGQQIIRSERPEVSHAWLMVGALTALAVVLRETFVSFAVLGLIVVFVARGRKAALRYFLGGVATGIVLIGGLLLARGGVMEAIFAYRDWGLVFEFTQDRVSGFFTYYGLMAIEEASVALCLSLLAILVLVFIAIIRRSKRIALNLLFWLSFIGFALIEPITKIGVAYHFAMTLPGFAGICALALREIAREWPHLSWANRERRDAITLLGVTLLVVWLSSMCFALSRSWWPQTQETLIAAPTGGWAEESVSLTNYLLAAGEIKKVMPENGTLSTSGHMNSLYPLTGHLPPSYQLGNLSIIALKSDLSVSRIQEALMVCAPDVIMVYMQDDGWFTGYGHKEILAAVMGTGVYEAVTEIPAARRGYGLFISGIIFKKTKETICLVK